jgi:hypothetical protein
MKFFGKKTDEDAPWSTLNESKKDESPCSVNQ